MTARHATLPLLLTALTLAACGGADDPKGASTTSTVRTTSASERTRTTSTADQGGAQVASGPGSASVGPTGAPAEAGLGTDSAGTNLRPFATSSPWNTPVDTQAVDPRSPEWIARVKVRRGVEERGDAVTVRNRPIDDGIFINTKEWTTPIVDEEGAVETRVVCRQLKPYCGDGKNVDSLLIPPDVDPRPQNDGWYTVLNRQQGVAYDMWRARRGRDGNVFSYQFMRRWDLNGPGFLEPNTVSARGSGLPLFAGVILPEEIQAGRIEHALAIALPGPATRRYVQPASATDGVGDIASLPEGARVRLKRGFELTFRRCPQEQADEDAASAIAVDVVPDSSPDVRCFADRTNRRAARAIVRALKTYGAIVVDRARVPTLFAKLNANWSDLLRDPQGRLLDSNGRLLSRFVRNLPNQGTPLLRGSEVQQLRIDDFEVVRTTSPILTFPPLDATQAGTRTGSGTADQSQTQTTSTTATTATTSTAPAPSTTSTTGATAP